MKSPAEIMNLSPVIPVLVIESADTAIALARALVEGGLRVLEVTLRSGAALPSIAAIVKALPDAVVGAGTVLNANDYKRASDAGARFIVSPGITDPLLEAARDGGIPLLPGVATAGEIMRCGRESLRRAVRAGALLPDRRDHALECARLSRAGKRPMRRRLMVGAKTSRREQGLEGCHTARKRGGRVGQIGVG